MSSTSWNPLAFDLPTGVLGKDLMVKQKLEVKANSFLQSLLCLHHTDMLSGPVRLLALTGEMQVLLS